MQLKGELGVLFVRRIGNAYCKHKPLIPPRLGLHHYGYLLIFDDEVISSRPLRFQSLGALSCLDALDPCLHVFVSRGQRDAELVEHSDAWRKADVR